MDSKDKAIIATEADKAAAIIRKGGIILYPTDTIWGLGCDATNPQAVKKIYDLKRRQDSKSMLVLLGQTDDLYKWLDNVPETAKMLLEVADSPLTIIYDCPRGVADNLIADDGSLGIRIADDEFCKSLCRRCNVPVVSTSANISGTSSPAGFNDIDDLIKEGVDYIVDYKREDMTNKRPSAIIKVRDDETLKIIR